MNRHFFQLMVLLIGCTGSWGSWLSPALAQSSSRNDSKPTGDEKTREFLAQFDKNKDGQLTREELPDFAAKFVSRLAERKNLNVDQPMSIETLVQATIENRDEKQDRKEEKKNGAVGPQAPGFGGAPTTSEKAASFSVPLTNDFPGLELEYDQKVRDHMNREVLARYDRNQNGMLEIGDETRDGKWNPELSESDLNKDGRLDKAEMLERYAKKFNLPRKSSSGTVAVAAAASPNTSNSTSNSSSGGSSEKVREYAQGLLNRYDKSKNGFLEKDEWKEMKSDYHAADLNKDNIITLDELAAKLGGYSTSSSSSSNSGTTPPATSSSSSSSSKPTATSRKWWQNNNSASSSKEAEKKSLRFLTPLERLPKGLPDWFARNDANGDGQVMMSEYAASWSEATVAEFQKYDLDGDGNITPEECLAVEKGLKK
jgi:Ca2+-binding EF-hand superfamily protein